VIKAAHRYGDLTVTGSDEDRVILSAVIRATASDARTAARLADEIDVALLPGFDTVLVVTLFPESGDLPEDRSYEVHLDISVPRSARLVTRNSFGNSTITNHVSAVHVHSRFGDVAVDRCRDCEIVSRHGSVRVRRSTGRLALDNRFGDVFLDSITARASVENRYGDIVALIQDPRLTDLDVNSELGRVQLRFDRFCPFRIEGTTIQGDIASDIPLALGTEGFQRFVSGAHGEGGPFIRLTGTWADFSIQTGEEPAAHGERR